MLIDVYAWPLASSMYLINRRQIIGGVSLLFRLNPSFWRFFQREFLLSDSKGQKNCRTGNVDGRLGPIAACGCQSNATEIYFQTVKRTIFGRTEKESSP